MGKQKSIDETTCEHQDTIRLNFLTHHLLLNNEVKIDNCHKYARLSIKTGQFFTKISLGEDIRDAIDTAIKREAFT